MSGLQQTRPAPSSSHVVAVEVASDTTSEQAAVSGTSANTTSSAAISVLLFASLRDVARADHIVVQVGGHPPSSTGQNPQNTQITVAALLERCAIQYPQLAPWLPHVRVAVNCEYTDAQGLITPGDEVALLPPVSGGACE